jgi:hypothetical protein
MHEAFSQLYVLGKWSRFVHQLSPSSPSLLSSFVVSGVVVVVVVVTVVVVQ